MTRPAIAGHFESSYSNVYFFCRHKQESTDVVIADFDGVLFRISNLSGDKSKLRVSDYSLRAKSFFLTFFQRMARRFSLLIVR